MKAVFIILSLVIIGSIVSAGYFLFKKEKIAPDLPPFQIDQVNKVNKEDNAVKLTDFSKINPEFLFSAKIPKEFEAEYIPKSRAINIFNPSLAGNSNIEKSQIYISFFKAGRFLTLSAVNIDRRDKMIVKEKEAVLYEITKKETAPDFSGQPFWRNQKHKALDIRLTQDNPSYFYSLAYNPDLPEEIIDGIIASLVFYSPN